MKHHRCNSLGRGRAFRNRIPLKPSELADTTSTNPHKFGITRSSIPAASWSASRSPTGSGGPSGETGDVATIACACEPNDRNDEAANRYANNRTDCIAGSQPYSIAWTRGPPSDARSGVVVDGVTQASARGHCRGNQ